MTHLSTKTLAEVAAHSLGTLGYQPTESILVTTMVHDVDGTIIAGPVLRADLGDKDRNRLQDRHLAGMLARLDYDVVHLALGVVTEDPTAYETARETFQTVAEQAEDGALWWELRDRTLYDHEGGESTGETEVYSTGIWLEHLFHEDQAAPRPRGQAAPAMAQATREHETWSAPGADVFEAWSRMVTGKHTESDLITIAAEVNNASSGLVPTLAHLTLNPGTEADAASAHEVIGDSDITAKHPALRATEARVCNELAQFIHQDRRGPLWEFLAWSSWVQGVPSRAEQCLRQAGRTENPARGILTKLIQAQDMPRALLKK